MVQNIQVSPDRGLDSYPLSPMQQGMLFHSLEPAAAGVDVEQVVCELHEEVDAAQFEAAWRDVVARHAILRTGFHWRDGEEPVQVVHAPTHVRLVFRCEEFGSELEARRGLEEYLAADRRAGFNVAEAPLVRVALIRGGPARYWWVATFHHLILDGRAMVVVFREAMDLHDARVAGRRLELPAAPAYRTYIDWLQSRDWTREEKFWREHLRGFSAPTRLPVGRAADEAADVAHGELAFRLPQEAMNRLRAGARRHDVTVNTLVQAAWAIVLSRYAGETDVVFGAVRACRHVPIEGAGAMVGLFINTVPVRVRVEPGASLGAWLQELRELWLALRDHEHTPLMKIQQWSGIEPGSSLFDTLVNYQEPSWDTALRALGGAWTERQFEIRSQPNYPLALDACGGATLTAKLIFDARRFPVEAMARMLGHVRTVLEALGGEAATLGEVPMLAAVERRQLLHDWNRTAVAYPDTSCVQALFEAHAAQAPGALAAADSRGTLTYSLLNQRANQLAHRLVALGVGPEVTVAACLERSLSLLVAWLAVAKAGGAFVPLDPAYPKERLAFQLGDCGAPVLLTQARVRAALPSMPASVAVLELAADGSGFENEPAHNLPPRSSACDLAYVIYTSGSTGQPKGVQVEHRALMNLVTWHQRAYGITASDRAMQVASPAFDASVWEIWPYLTAGASLFIPDDEIRLDPATLLRWIAEQRITIGFLPTPLAEVVLREKWPERIALRALLTGGDKLKRPAPVDLPCTLFNHYGPTESAVVATCNRVPRSARAVAPAIGRPIANTQVYVLDAERQPVPVGVPGELYIGGESLARGYLNRPELTAEKFVAHPFVGGEKRLYRTGDLVRWRADGELEFIGRIDGQVKIRGCRIELGEIEAALQQHPAVREALVVPWTDAQGEAQLAAYVVGRDGEGSASGTELAEFLRAKVPGYMVPAAVTMLSAWPLTANGKIDRRALPAPDAGATARPLAAPETPAERLVVQAWAEVLGRESIGRDDNFFELGGHSLLAAQVVSRLNAVLGGGLSVRSIFDHPTVAGLAREIAPRLETTSTPRLPLTRLKRRTPRPELELVQPN